MRRQALHALNALEREHLAVIRGRPGAAGRYDRVQFLDESGHRTRSPFTRHYRIPSSTAPYDSTVTLPKEFFLQGWVHVLSTAEIATYLMILDLQARHPQAGSGGVYKVAHQRVDWFGVRRDVYATHRQLAGYGLIRRHDDPHRRPDGRIIRRASRRAVFEPYHFSTIDGGFDQPALATVAAHLEQHRTKGDSGEDPARTATTLDSAGRKVSER